MLGRKQKLTTDKDDRKDQRDKTEQLISATKDMDSLQVTPPKELQGIARYLWTQLVPILNEQKYIKQADKSIVEMLCMQYELARRSYKDIQDNGTVKPVFRTVVNPVTGEVISKDFTGYKRNPSTQILDAATNKIKALSTELGLSPESRASLLKIDDGDKDAPSIEDMRKAFGA